MSGLTSSTDLLQKSLMKLEKACESSERQSSTGTTMSGASQSHIHGPLFSHSIISEVSLTLMRANSKTNDVLRVQETYFTETAFVEDMYKNFFAKNITDVILLIF